MSACFEIASASGAYSVAVDNGLFARALEPTDDQIVLADDYFAKRLADAGVAVIPISASEASKSLDAIPPIIESLRDHGATRKTNLLAIGGGAVQDVAGFVASIFMRGIRWTYMPTTLLGMVDSCIGGKSSINVGRHKNLAGTFHPPTAIFIDPELSVTLSNEQRVAGLCEAAKICFARGAASFEAYRALDPSISSSAERLSGVIELSLSAKKWFIEIDEFDDAERLLLNFGHTFGHALESASDFQLTHGVAVGVGILAAIHFARMGGRVGSLDREVRSLENHVAALLGEVAMIGGIAEAIKLEDVWTAFQSDKKHTRLEFRIVVPAEGALPLDRIDLPRGEANKARILSAFDHALSRFGGSRRQREAA